VSHDPSEIILILFAAQETVLLSMIKTGNTFVKRRDAFFLIL